MITTDNKRIFTDTNPNLLYRDLTYRIRGACFTVYNALGFGHKEEVYQKALMKEFTTLLLPFQREVSLRVQYKGEAVGSYRPDFIIDSKVILELKAVEFMAKSFETQLLHYLKTTGYSLGLLINFGAPKLSIKRIIWTENPRKSALNP